MHTSITISVTTSTMSHAHSPMIVSAQTGHASGPAALGGGAAAVGWCDMPVVGSSAAQYVAL